MELSMDEYYLQLCGVSMPCRPVSRFVDVWWSRSRYLLDCSV